MIDAFTSSFQQFLLDVLGEPWLVVLILACLPVVEARMAIPMALSFGFNAPSAFLLGFLGSSILAPLLLLALMPLINLLKKSKLFGSAAAVIEQKFVKKSEGVKNRGSDRKRFWGILIFVAVPLPMTGVWTGCAVASLSGLNYYKSLLAVLFGNAIASAAIALLCSLFSTAVINCIITALGIIAILTAVWLLVKTVIGAKKPSEK